VKVLHVMPYPGVGGTEIATRRVVDAVRPFGVESRALLLRPTAEQRDYFRAAGVPTVTPAVVPEPSFRRGLRFLRDSRALARATMDVDLVHCADIPAAYRVALAGRLAGVPVLSHVRNRHAAIGRRERLFIKAVSHFAFVSANTRTSFAWRLPDRKTSIVYDGVDIPPDAALSGRGTVMREVRAEFGLSDGETIVAMFARVAPQKDYETLIQAATLLRHSLWPLRLVIVGDHSGHPDLRLHYDRVRRLIAEADLADRFLFTGFRDDTRRLMLAADVCLLSTHFEGLPLVILEAMALGRPCVATAVDGIPEMLDDDVTGLLYPLRDAAALADRLIRLASDRALAQRLGAAARAEARRRFGQEQFASKIFDLYTCLRHSKRSLVWRARPGAADLPAAQS
jgi:glycosyltransferase involved in cell wall biosynthesis